MKKREPLFPWVEKIARFAPSSGGVFSYPELFHLTSATTPLQGNRVIKRLLKEGVIYKICRGFYVTKNPDLWMLASRIKKKVYISTDSVLAKNGLIGTVPERTVTAVYTGQKRKILKTPFGTIRFLSIQRQLMFGTTRTQQGILVANSEKAYLDLLYYYTKGVRFVIDPLQEVNLQKLDRKKIKFYQSRVRLQEKI